MSTPDEDAAKAADLRYTEHQRNAIRVERDLSGGGHLARGDKTKMSRLNFSARARPADPGERDGAFTVRPADPPAASAPDAPAPDACAPAVEPAPPESGLIDKVTRFFGR